MRTSVPKRRCRNLILVLGDQLDRHSAALCDSDRQLDVVWMAEVGEESTHVWSHKARIALFLAAMRHYRDWLQDEGYTVHYTQLDDPKNRGTLSAELAAAIGELQPERLVVVEPGEYRVLHALRTLAGKHDVPLEVRTDEHFLSTIDEFNQHAEGRKQLRQEYFYRELRKKHGILLEDGHPVGGKWNYDAKNRGSFGRSGPGEIKAPRSFRTDEITDEVLELVRERFAEHPGSLDEFDWPVTPQQAKWALDDFIEHRLPMFGKFQDAMWTDRPWLYHSRLSVALNLKLIDPRDVIAKAEAAYRDGDAPLAAVEGFIRQILGWREYVRGVYWRFMPEYLSRNELGADAPLPEFYWTGETDMQCLRQAIGQTLEFGYAHHIQRLMVTGLFALLLGVDPRQVHQWYLAVYVDAVEWVELPNTLGMSQYADGGVMASKPYAATGKYIQRMSNYCSGCRYDPAQATGEDACPFTTLYWDFLARHEQKLAANTRMSLQVKNLDRKSAEELKQIRKQAADLRAGLA
ncbi:MAG: cryptochrome/photolyase family protein [Planctomycetaceae bacterium]|nr:cryptochrome/photolyase family protein [Planctomycetaceae bacterium]